MEGSKLTNKIIFSVNRKVTEHTFTMLSIGRRCHLCHDVAQEKFSASVGGVLVQYTLVVLPFNCIPMIASP